MFRGVSRVVVFVAPHYGNMCFASTVRLLQNTCCRDEGQQEPPVSNFEKRRANSAWSEFYDLFQIESGLDAAVPHKSRALRWSGVIK